MNITKWKAGTRLTRQKHKEAENSAARESERRNNEEEKMLYR